MNKNDKIKWLENENKNLYFELKEAREKNKLLIDAFQYIHEEIRDIKVILKKYEAKK